MLDTSGPDLSLRHLPDLSDASSSFQIPVTSSDDFLLEDGNDDNFFQGADDSLITPGPTRLASKPLTLSQLTPRPTKQPSLAVTTWSSGKDSHSVTDKTSPRAADNKIVPAYRREKQDVAQTLVERSPLKSVTQRIEFLDSSALGRRESGDVCTANLGNGPPIPVTETRRVEPLSYQRLQAGVNANAGISLVRLSFCLLYKTLTFALSRKKSPSASRLKRAGASSSLANHVQFAPESRGYPRGYDKQLDADISISSSTTDEAAERLVIYSQKFVSSFGYV